jgi:hypothetical protein
MGDNRELYPLVKPFVTGRLNVGDDNHLGWLWWVLDRYELCSSRTLMR